MPNKFVFLARFAALTAVSISLASADPGPGVPTVGSVWGHTGAMQMVSTAGQSSIYSDPLAHSVGDLITIVVDLNNSVEKDQNTTTAKTAAVDAVINSLLYPNDNSNKGYNFLNYHGANPTTQWNATQSFGGGGTVKNTETTSTTIQARVVSVLPNGVLQVEARRLSKAGDEDTSIILTGQVRPDDLSTSNTISSSQVAELQIIQKGKGTLTANQRKGWLTKLYETIEPFNHVRTRIFPEVNPFLLTGHRVFLGLVFLALAFVLALTPAKAQSRVKDVASVVGARDNQLIGYGLVAGLDGQGDSDKLFTQQTVANMARRFGVQILPTDLTNKNVALVMITCKVPAFSQPGTKLNVTVASLADAKSLQGGVLLQTPLIGGDGQVYAVAQGSVFLGGFEGGAGGLGGSTVTKNHLNSGVVTNGALVETAIPTTVFSKGVLQIVLNNGDFTSAVRLANAINEQVAPIAEAVSPTTVDVYVPQEMQCPEKQMEFVARIENASFVPDVNARIVINERTGTIVANANIQISKIAVAFGNLTVAIASNPEVSQPNSFTGNAIGNGAVASPGVQTAVVNQTTTSVQEEKRRMVVFKTMPTVEEVAFALNSMGATPRELMSILQSIKDAGALNAELVLE